MPIDDRLRRRVQVPSTAVEAQALPDGEDVIEGGCCEIAHRGKPFEKSLVVRCAACDPSPLEEVFGDQDSIGISRAPPGEVPAICIIPREQACANLVRGGIAHRRHDAPGDISGFGPARLRHRTAPLTLDQVEGSDAKARSNGFSGSLEYLARLAAPEQQVEGRHRNSNRVRELLGPCLDVQVSPRSQGPWHAPEDAMADQVPEDMAVQNREVFASARVPKEMTRLLQAQARDLADEPDASVLRGGKRLQRRPDFAMAIREQSVSRADDIRGFVVVEARAMTQELRNLRGFAGPQEFGLSQTGDGRVGRSGLGLNGHDAEA